jgi:hypothetical protein
MLHHDDAPARASLLNHSFLTKYRTSVASHPLYSPDLVPADLFLIPKLKTTLKGRGFQIIDEIKENALREIRTITKDAFQEEFQHWKIR